MLESRTTALRRILGLRRFPLFAMADLDEVATLAENLIDRTYSPGTVLTSSRESARVLHLIVEGRVHVPSIGRTWQAPHALGALEVLAGRAVAFDSLAASHVRTFQLSALDLGELLEDNFGLMLATVRELATRLLGRPTTPQLGRTAPPLHAGHPVGLVERLLALRGQLPFANAPLQALTTLAKTSEEATWPAGFTVMRPDSADRFGLVVLDGKLGVECDGRCETLGPGSSVGFLEVLAETTPRHEVRALTPLRGLQSKASAILDVIEDHTDVGLAMISAFAAALLDTR